MRIVSLSPGATDAIALLGHGAELVGRSAGCDHPLAVGAPVIGPGAPAVREAEAEALESFLEAGPPHVLVAPAALLDVLDAALLEATRVVGWDPTGLDALLDLLVTVGRAVDDVREGLALRSHVQRRLEWLRRAVTGRPQPSLAVVRPRGPVTERWIADVVQAAGAQPALAGPLPDHPAPDDGAPEAGDVVVFGLDGIGETARDPDADGLAVEWGTVGTHIYAVDGRRLLFRPGPRLIEVVEALAWALHRPHPDLAPAVGVIARWTGSDWTDLGAAVTAPGVTP